MKREIPWRPFLVAALSVLAVVSCQKQPAQPVVEAPPPAMKAVAAETAPAPEAEPQNPCNTGPVNNPNQPILCVDDSAFPAITLAPTDPVHLTANRTVHWFTKSGAGTIGILYDSSLLNAPDEMPGAGHTKAKAKTQTGSVKYSVVVQKGDAVSNVIDPTIIIDPAP